MNDQFSNDSLTDSTDSTEITEESGKGSIWVGSLICGAVPALIVGFGAVCYQTGYKEAVNEARPTIVHGNQTVNNQKIYQIAPSIGSNNNNSHNK
ncbi:hypothetical protein QUB75_04830 [Microcoleus sp. K1-B6]|uniref:hypothetical protein n=1 Tax=unclassified Microcoleus TaxID=2642155 RepID=UPI002FCF2B89